MSVACKCRNAHFRVLIADLIGRKPVILGASVVFAVGSVVMGVANEKVALLIGRIIVGVGIGKSTSVMQPFVHF